MKIYLLISSILTLAFDALALQVEDNLSGKWRMEFSEPEKASVDFSIYETNSFRELDGKKYKL